MRSLRGPGAIFLLTQRCCLPWHLDERVRAPGGCLVLDPTPGCGPWRQQAMLTGCLSLLAAEEGLSLRRVNFLLLPC